MIVDWIYDHPTWMWGNILVWGAVAFACLGLAVLHRFVRVEVRRDHNDLAGFMIAIISVVYVTLRRGPSCDLRVDRAGKHQCKHRCLHWCKRRYDGKRRGILREPAKADVRLDATSRRGGRAFAMAAPH